MSLLCVACLLALRSGDPPPLPIQRPPESLVDFAVVADVDADGIGDLVVKTDERAYVVSGGSGRPLFAVMGVPGHLELWNERHSIAALGDVDRDAVGDFAIAWSTGGQQARSTVLVHSGRDGRRITSIELPGAPDDGGLRIASPGDLDGDGYADLLIGANWIAGGRGVVRAVSGATWKDLYAIEGEMTDARLGADVVASGDLDGDGSPDFALVASRWRYNRDSPLNERCAYGSGALILVSGRRGVILRHVLGSDLECGVWGRIGSTLEACGDLDGDDVPDFLISWQTGSWSPADESFVAAISGKHGTLVRKFRGVEATFDEFGFSFSCAGDVDGDGVPDVLVGDPEANGLAPDGNLMAPVDSGRVCLFSGRSGKCLRDWRETGWYQLFGSAVVDAGDLDGDGRSDVWIAVSSLHLGSPEIRACSSATGARIRSVYTAVVQRAGFK